MTLEVLLSCMNEKSDNIIEKSNIESDIVIVNQTNQDIISKYKKNNINVTYIKSTSKGLSNSRNIAIENSTADICLLCDDDIYMIDGYSQKIIDAFEKNNKADI